MAGNSTGKVLVPLLPGFEEIEAVTIIDVLRRADIPVLVASDVPGAVRGSHDIEVVAEVSLADVRADDLAMIVLPGGMPGAARLAEHERVQALVQELDAAGRYTAAICAGPMALASAGVVAGKRATCYPGFGERLTGAELSEERVVIDGTVITSRGPGTALEFSLTLVEQLRGAQAARSLGERMLARA